MVCVLLASRIDLGKSGSFKFKRLAKDGSFWFCQFERKNFPEKPLGFKGYSNRTKTDTGRRGEKPQVNERTFVKELGKKSAVSSQ